MRLDTKKLFKSISALLLIVFWLWIDHSRVLLACTGVYIGNECTADGSYIWGRSEDVIDNYSKIFTTRQRETHQEGEMWVDSKGFSFPYPAETLRYSVVSDSMSNEGAYPEPYGAAGMNEKGVVISASVTLSEAQNNISSVDPLVRTGLNEQSVVSFVLMQAVSAKNGIELIADMVNRQGSAEHNGIMVSDSNEVWYMEIVSGHQYAAVKAPAGQVGYSPNLTMLGAVDVNDSENVIASPGLITTANEAGVLKTDEKGWILVNESYGKPEKTVPLRMLLGYRYLKSQQEAMSLTSGYYDYFTEPRKEGNYTLFEVMRLLAHRGQNTIWDAGNATGNDRSIGNDNTLECHVFWGRPGLPDALSTVEWLCMGPAEFSVYIPYYTALITDTYEGYYVNDGSLADANSVYGVFRQLYDLCKKDRTNYGSKVMEFWEQYQQALISAQDGVDRNMLKIYQHDVSLAEEKATQLGKQAAKEAYDYAKKMLQELQAFIESGAGGVFMPSALEERIKPNYNFEAIGGTGLPPDQDGKKAELLILWVVIPLSILFSLFFFVRKGGKRGLKSKQVENK